MKMEYEVLQRLSYLSHEIAAILLDLEIAKQKCPQALHTIASAEKILQGVAKVIDKLQALASY